MITGTLTDFRMFLETLPGFYADVSFKLDKNDCLDYDWVIKSKSTSLPADFTKFTVSQVAETMTELNDEIEFRMTKRELALYDHLYQDRQNGNK